MTVDVLPAKVLVVFGTRPEAVKLFPVIDALQNDARFEVKVVVTGQHREMVTQILTPFGIVPDADLAIMRERQTLNEIVARVLPRLDALYSEMKPDLVMVQGDTTSAFTAGLAAFHRRIPVAHLEAGLRSFDRFHPYPEESNRRMLSAVADVHLAPTAASAENLVREGVAQSDIVVTGNTAVDSLLMTLERTSDTIEDQDAQVLPRLEGDGRVVLITVHRRESWGSGDPGDDRRLDSPLVRILTAIAAVARSFPAVDFVYPVHPNPLVRGPASDVLGMFDNVSLVEPLDYVPFVHLMARSTCILTDSGGIQEEAPSLGVPVLVARETTERPEGIECGVNRLVGTSTDEVFRALREELQAPARPRGGLPYPNPYGDGRARERVLDAIFRHLRPVGAEEGTHSVAVEPALL